MASKKQKKSPKGTSSQIRSQLKGIRSSASKTSKGLSKSIAKSQKKLSSQNTQIQSELAKLRADLKASKTKRGSKQGSRQLSMYNLFVGKRIKQGKTFEQAVNAWKKYHKIIENPELAKRKTRTITKTKTIIRRIKSPPQEPAKEIVRVEKLPKDARDSLSQIVKELSKLKTEVNTIEKEAHPVKKNNSIPVPAHSVNASLPSEEVAVRLTRLYFEEIARLGFKRRLDFDSIINAYYYCLQRLQNKDKEMMIMSKIVAREESKLAGETKSEMFPSGRME